MEFNGSKAIADGRLVGTTDTDYFYFFCPQCGDRHVMRVLDYDVRHEGPVQAYPDVSPQQVRDFILVFKLYCPNCKLTDFVKIGNTGWQGGRLPEEASRP
jgi:predicted RNA-binding Zn-ribbon protein involved in translation (DUF1610 family)